MLHQVTECLKEIKAFVVNKPVAPEAPAVVSTSLVLPKVSEAVASPVISASPDTVSKSVVELPVFLSKADRREVIAKRAAEQDAAMRLERDYS